MAASPSLNTGDRRWLLSTLAALDRRAFTDEGQRRLEALGYDVVRDADVPVVVVHAVTRLPDDAG